MSTEPNHEHHGGTENPPSDSPAPLLDNATVTIYFDGLIFSTFDDKNSLYKTAVLTEAEGHEVVLEVRQNGNVIFPTAALPWDKSHPVVKKLAPFWLYVDSGQGLGKGPHSAQLYLPPPEAKDERSFDRIFNFEEVHGHPFNPKPETFAVFNFPEGTCYSAENVNARLKSVAQGAPAATAVDVRKIDVSTLSAIDIDAVSDASSQKSIVLVNEHGHEFFRFPLDAGKHYEIQILNVPINAAGRPHAGHINATQHFLQFYELFNLKPGEQRFLVSLPPPPPTPLSPPCVTTTGRPKSGI